MATAAVAAAAAARRGAAAAGWRAALCSLQQACLPQPQQAVQAHAAAAHWQQPGARALSAGAWAAQLLPHAGVQGHLPRQQHHEHQQWRQQGSPASVPLRWYSTEPKDVSSSSSSCSQQRLPEQQPQEQQDKRRQRAPAAGAAMEAAGWSRQEVYNVPNALSMLRLLSGPLIAHWILDGQWALALPALAISGATDWADGYAARRFNQPSVIGSYLDPLADKVLICSVVGALGWSGVLPGPVVAIIVGRDVVLVTGVFVLRAKMLGWRWPGWAEFFRVQPATAGGSAGAGAGLAGVGTAAGPAAGGPAGAAAGGGCGADAERAPPAPRTQPLLISKVNTVFQLGLVGTCILHSWQGWPGEGAVWVASAATAGTTLWSCWAYLQAYLQGRLLAAAPQ